jgi:hypothetical protein
MLFKFIPSVALQVSIARSCQIAIIDCKSRSPVVQARSESRRISSQIARNELSSLWICTYIANSFPQSEISHLLLGYTMVTRFHYLWNIFHII